MEGGPYHSGSPLRLRGGSRSTSSITGYEGRSVITSHRHLVRNTLAYAIPEFFWGFGWTLAIDNPMPAAFAKGFDGSESLIGSFGLVAALGLGLPMLFTGYLLEPMRRKRGLVFWGHLLPATLLGLLALYLHLASGASDTVTQAAYLIGMAAFFLSIGLLVPAWFSLVGDLFPDGLRARVLGIAFAVNRVGGLIGGVLAERVLASAWSPTDQWTLLFGVAGAVLAAGCLPYLLLVEEPRPAAKRQPFRKYVRHVANTFRDLPELRRFIRVDLMGVTAIVLFAFYGDAAIRKHGAHESWAGVWARTTAASQLVFALLIVWAGARIAPRIWLAVGAAAVAAGSVLGALASSPMLFSAVAAAAGAYMVIRMTCQAPQVMRLAPGRDSTAPIALAWTATMPVQGLAPFTAGLLIPGIGYAPIFAAVGLLAVVCVVLLLTRIPDHAVVGT